MRSVRLAAGALALFGAGCGMLSVRPIPETHRLPPGDAAFAQALAHFAQGIVLEAEAGRGNAAALAAFKEATRLDPATPMLSDLVTAGLLQQGRTDEALAELQRRCRLAPVEESHANLAQVAETAGRYELALRHYAKAARLNPREPSWRHAQVRVLFKARHDRDALRLLRRQCLRGGGHNDPAPAYLWGVSFIERGQEPERGLASLQLALRCATNGQQRAQVREAMAAGELQRGNTNEARRALWAAAAEDFSDVGRAARLYRFDLLVSGEEATNLWRKTVASQPDDVTAWMALTHDAAARRDWPAARDCLLRAREICERRRIVPLAPSFYSMLGHVLEESGHREDAEAALVEGLRAHHADAMLQNHLAYFWAVLNVRLDEAEKLVRQALREEPRNGAFVDTLGWIYFRQNRLDEALAQLTLAESLEGEDPTILDHLGDVLLALGRKTEAVAYWHRSLRLDPTSASVAEKLRRHSD
ncbi:MAG: tetratricopeptide repeat protein [Kiritimatiellae bacterium]|nr:tetratricopeptide repeat protein [Kiritimatiellia bacterium]